MICKSLMILAMVCLLAAAASISLGMASEDGAMDLSALNAVDEVSMTDDVDEGNNTTSLNSTNQSSNESSAENVIDLSALDVVDEESITDDVDEVNNTTSSNSANQSSNESSAEDVNVSVVDLSTLDTGSETAENADVTVISYMPPSSSTDGDGAELSDVEVTDVRILSDVLGAFAAENALDLSTLGEGSMMSNRTDGSEVALHVKGLFGPTLRADIRLYVQNDGDKKNKTGGLPAIVGCGLALALVT